MAKAEKLTDVFKGIADDIAARVSALPDRAEDGTDLVAAKRDILLVLEGGNGRTDHCLRTKLANLAKLAT